MIETKKVKLTDIRYDGRTTYISVVGRDQLQVFAEHGSMNCYDSSSAPTEYLVEITADFDEIDQVSDTAKSIAEDELGLTIRSFRLLY